MLHDARSAAALQLITSIAFLFVTGLLLCNCHAVFTMSYQMEIFIHKGRSAIFSTMDYNSVVCMLTQDLLSKLCFGRLHR